MSTHLCELCALLIEDTFGSLPSTIFATIYRHGRLDVPQIQLHTRFPLNIIRHNLPVLIQHGFVLYDANDRHTYYEVNARATYNIVRFSKNAQLVAHVFGSKEADFVQNLQLLGYATGEEVLEQQSLRMKNETEVNGSIPRKAPQTGSSQASSTEALADLTQAQYVLPVQDSDFMPETDLRLNIIESIKSRREFAGRVPQTGKDKKTFWAAVSNERLNKRKAAEGPISDTESKINGAHPYKKRKINGTSARAISPEDSDGEVESKPVGKYEALRINHDKFDVVYRSERLVALACRSLGEPTSRVYGALLQALEVKIQRCYDPLADPGYQLPTLSKSPSVTANEVHQALISSDCDSLSFEGPPKTGKAVKGKKEEAPTSEQLSTGQVEIHKRKPQKPNGVTHKPINEINPIIHLSDVHQHLRLLSEHPNRFVHIYANETYKVNFAALSRRLIQNEIETVITPRFGNLATRLIRILHQKGKMDEKHLASIGLMRQKEVRSLLAAMQEAGYVETQEIPRDPSRQPNRTIYLWSFDQERCASAVLDQTCQAMSRLLQRRNFERDKHKRLFEKAARQDVQEDDLLNKQEKAAMEKWEKMEETFLVQVERCDDVVMVLRDFMPIKSP